MNKELSKYSSYKLYIWKLLHSLINYFFNIYVKKKYSINDNCYLYFKKIGYYNQILINYINFSESKYFSFLNLKLVKLILNFNTKVPILRINKINIKPKIFSINKYTSLFSIWSKHVSTTFKTLNIFNNLYDELSKFAVLEIGYIDIDFECFKIKLSNIKFLKNVNKTRIFIDKLQIFYKNNYCCSINKFKLSHDNISGTINIFAKKMLITIRNYILKHDIFKDINNILNKFKLNDNGKSPNIYFDKIEIQLMIHNHIIFELNKVINEANIVKFDGLVKIWKKQIFWIKQFKYNLSDNSILIDDIRIRLFKSSADKLFKTFRPIYKTYYNKKPPKLKSIFKKITSLKPDHNYLCNFEYKSFNNNPFKITTFNLDCKKNYIISQLEETVSNLFKINKLTIDFQDNKGSFIFDNFTYSNIEDGIRISASNWLFIKNKIIYLDSVDKNSTFMVEYKNNSLSIYPYKLYLNLDLDIFSETFGMFTSSIGKIIDIFVIHRLHKNYIYDKFYIHSCRIIFSYQTKQLQLFKLISGKYSELINILELHKMNFIVQPIIITYPKNFTEILSTLLNKLLEDIIENNFDTLIKATPIALSYKLTKKLSDISNVANKCYNIITNY